MQQQQGNAPPAAAGGGGTAAGNAEAAAAAARAGGGVSPTTAAASGGGAQRPPAGGQQASAPQQRTTAAANASTSQARAQNTPSATASPASAAQQQQAGGGYRPLNVKDALSYLDSVKIQFNDRPQIYNNFLDIMKDFKTQNIDTPGVIDRVSSLFRGHPALIQGFNTFLPPGYKIDCAFDAAGRDIITITTPHGVTRRDGGGGTLSNSVRGHLPSQPPQIPQQQQQQNQTAASNTSIAAGKGSLPDQSGRAGAANTPSAPGTSVPGSASAQQSGLSAANPGSAPTNATISKGPSPFSGGIAGINPSRPAPGGSSALPPSAASGASNNAAANNAASASRAGQATNMGSSSATPAPGTNSAQILGYNRNPTSVSSSTSAAAAAAGRPPAEFNHAINFVNKIKTRFAGRPNTYKAFLEILQTYQKEQKSIQEVYAQVTVLFQEAPDLLEEFKEFLPDHTGSAGLSGAQSSAIDQASASNAAASAQAAAAATQSRTGRNTSTTSLFGVNASSTSQPQPGGVPSYLHAAQRDRSRVGQPLAGASLDVAASRRQVQPEQQQPSTSQIPPLPVAAVQDKVTHDDDEWQAPGSARKRKATATAAPPVVEKPKQQVKRGKYALDESPEEAMPQYGANRGYVPNYPPPIPNGMPAPVQPIILPHALRPHGPKTQVQAMIGSEELGLFDRIKRYIDDKATYHEFLKLLNLYTAEIIDMPTLLEKAFLFIGGNDEIFGLFREFVGEQDGFVEGEEWPIDNAPALERERFELHNLKSYGPSYRKLPYQESKGLACSGRDALCWSVLNDNWVAYATWASEGSGAHRKNAFEDALACSEQERHWYDYHLNSIQRSIAVLEPIVARINLMSVEEKAAFKLKPGLGGESSSFYERIIRKIYGKDQGFEAISALYDSPGTAAPIILSRMKQKDEEWHRALREWNRVWREVDAKNFYRSIDHQGLTFKTNDKKTTTSKYLVSEIETLRKDQQQKRIFPEHKAASSEPLRPRHQFEMHLGDTDVIFDVLKLIFSYLDRATTSYGSKERLAIENTLRRFVPLLFNIGEKDVEANLAPAITFGEDGENGETDAADSDADENAASDTGLTSEASEQSTPVSAKKGKKSVADLRKKLLTSAMNGAHNQGNANGEEGAGDADEAKDDKEGDKVTLDETSWISASPVPYPAGSSTSSRTPPRSPSKLKSRAVPSPRAAVMPDSVKNALQDSAIARYNCFVSQPFYCFIRLFHLLYHRLATLKRLAAEIAAKEPAEERLNPFAVELGLAVPIANIDEPGVRRGKNFYEFALELCERYFDAEIDSATFEENLRYMWGIKAFPAFTVDKLVASMIKNAHTINGDQRCQELIDLLAKDREAERTSLRYQIAYRHTAESVLGTEENIYRLEWIPSEDVLTIQMLSPDDLTIDDPVLTTDKTWAHYLETYTLGLPTEGLRLDVRGPLLDRNREANGEAASRLQGKSDLAVRLGFNDFKLSYVSQTEETLFKAAPEDESAVEEASRVRREAWQRWIAATTGRESVEAEQPAAENANTVPVDSSSMAVDM